MSPGPLRGLEQIQIFFRLAILFPVGQILLRAVQSQSRSPQTTTVKYVFAYNLLNKIKSKFAHIPRVDSYNKRHSSGYLGAFASICVGIGIQNRGFSVFWSKLTFWQFFNFYHYLTKFYLNSSRWVATKRKNVKYLNYIFRQL